jgi:diaminohydroxyphosphoribosylaminopyrimidine deaminase / 5-amino-6-(5-phosphoribosylamino)uracil reductase
LSRLPTVTLKLATSLDSRIATASGESKWITGEEARASVHVLRSEHDAVLVGAETALADDPELTARTTPLPTHQPLRVVADSKLRLPDTARLIRTANLGPVLILIGAGIDKLRRAVLSAHGVQTAEITLAQCGLDPWGMLSAISAHGAQSVFLEGGGKLAASFLAADLVDRIEWFRAPILLGDDARPAIGPLALSKLSEAHRFRRTGLKLDGEDIRESLERVR